MLNLKEKHLKMIQDIFIKYCPNAEIWAYGSRISGDSHTGSDLDLTIKTFNDENKHIYELKNLFEENDIPFLVDIVEFDKLSNSFQKEIEKSYFRIFPLETTENKF